MFKFLRSYLELLWTKLYLYRQGSTFVNETISAYENLIEALRKRVEASDELIEALKYKASVLESQNKIQKDIIKSYEKEIGTEISEPKDANALDKDKKTLH